MMSYMVTKIGQFRLFLKEVLEEMEVASISSNMRIEGYTDFEIQMAIDNLRKYRQK